MTLFSLYMHEYQIAFLAEIAELNMTSISRQIRIIVNKYIEEVRKDESARRREYPNSLDK
jgi:hypothetical protein